MRERKFDRSLSIKTTGIREWPDGMANYNRCEPTPYGALDYLSKNYKLNKGDRLVDFGCGLGRVAFYMHSRFQLPIIGIEANSKVYDEAMSNRENYLRKIKNINVPIEFKHSLAQHYKVQASDNRFYFFNPFSVEIFEDVVHNILESVEVHWRTVDIILYYPMLDYIKALENKKKFQLCNELVVEGSKDSNQKFLIYRLD